MQAITENIVRDMSFKELNDLLFNPLDLNNNILTDIDPDIQ